MKNILIIDKTPSVHRIRDIATKMNFNLIEVQNSFQALSRLKTNPSEYALVFIDVMLEGEDGFKAVEQIKFEYPSLPVLILTSLNSRRDFLLGMKSGASDYILKPFDDALIEEKIHKNISAAPAEKRKLTEIFDIKKYLDTEIVKSKKGKYDLTIAMIVYYNSIAEKEIEYINEYDKNTEFFYKNIKNIFFETDTVITYCKHVVIAVLPFCGKNNINILRSKITSESNRIASKFGSSDIGTSCAFMTVPEDGDSTEVIIDRLFRTINHNIKKERLI